MKISDLRRTLDLATVTWRTSSYSSDGSNQTCVEVASITSGVAIRDSKDLSDAILYVDTYSWRRFISQIKRGQLDVDRKIT